MKWDIFLFHLINNLANRWSVLDMLGIFAAVFLLPMMVFLLVLATFTIKCLWEEHWYEMPIKAGVAALVGYGIRFVIGEIVGRGRPFAVLENAHQLVFKEATLDSFPSGHATLAFALAFVVFKQDRDWGIAFLILATIVAIGRVFTGLHFPLDIIGGAILGWLGAWIVHRIEHRQWGKVERALRAR